MGLTADDLAKVDSFIEDLKEQREMDDAAEHIKKIAEADVLKVQVCNMSIKNPTFRCFRHKKVFACYLT